MYNRDTEKKTQRGKHVCMYNKKKWAHTDCGPEIRLGFQIIYISIHHITYDISNCQCVAYVTIPRGADVDDGEKMTHRMTTKRLHDNCDENEIIFPAVNFTSNDRRGKLKLRPWHEYSKFNLAE